LLIEKKMIEGDVLMVVLLQTMGEMRCYTALGIISKFIDATKKLVWSPSPMRLNREAHWHRGSSANEKMSAKAHGL
jgi:hypothetical protein